MQEPISLEEDEKTSFDKDSLAATFKSTIEGKNEIIEALNNKIKVLEQTLKGYEASKQTTPKNIIAAGKRQVIINLEKKNQIMSPKGVSSTKSSTTNLNKIGNLKHSSTKKNFLFLNEVTKNIGKNSLKSSDIKSPRGTSPRINNSMIKSPNEKSSKAHPHHHSSDNGSILNQLQIIRERTKSVLERYRENHHSLVLKMRSMNNSELGR